MTKTTIYHSGGGSWKYYLVHIFLPGSEPEEVSEEQFFAVAGFDREAVPMRYDKDNINRQDFFLDGTLIGYRERSQ